MEMKKKLLALLAMLTVCCVAAAVAAGCNKSETGKSNSETPFDSSVMEKEVSVRLNKSSLTLEVSDEETLIATVENSEEDAVWTSDKLSVARVNENGKVTAVGIGTATIKATVEGKTAACIVTVSAPPISLHFYEEQLDLKVTEEYTVVLTCTNGEGTAVVWSADESQSIEILSSETTVSENKCKATIKANKTGRGSVSALVNGVLATLPVSVTDKYVLILNGVKETEKYLFLNTEYTLDYEFEKNGETGNGAEIKWSVSDGGLASLEDGVLTTADQSGTFTVKGVAGDCEKEIAFSTYIPLANAAEFANMANNLTANYVLTKSIDFAVSGKPSRVSSIAPYANTGASKDTAYFPQENEFEGVFDGNGYSLENYTPYAGNNTQNALFGAVGERGVIRNVSLINASMYLGGSALVYWCEGKVENIYLEMNVSGPTTVLTKNNPLAGVITKMQLQASIENCVVHMNLAAGKTYDNNNGTAIEKYGAVVGYMNSRATMKNCYAFNAWGLSPASLPINKDNIINSAVYGDGEIYKADYSQFDPSLWNITADNVPVLKNTSFTPALSCAETLSVQAGSAVALTVTAAGSYTVTLKNSALGVAITENANIVVESFVKSGTVFTLVIRSFCDGSVYREVVCTVS